MFAKLGLNPGESGGRFNNLDAIYRHPETKGTIFVGNQSAAQSLELLKKYKITRIVNCTDNMANFHEGKVDKVDKGSSSSSSDDSLKYLRFAVSYWSRSIRPDDSGPADCLRFLSPLFSFVDAALSAGRNVLVHCLAGAHRAGTTGVLLLMKYGGIPDVESAIKSAKKLRPIIDPIGMLPELLNKYKEARDRFGDCLTLEDATQMLAEGTAQDGGGGGGGPAGGGSAAAGRGPKTK